jgi:hypothetical protein
MMKDLPESDAKKLLKKHILKFSLLPNHVTDSKILFMPLIEYTMKSEKLIETQWFKSSTYTTSTSHLSGLVNLVIMHQAVMSSI